MGIMTAVSPQAAFEQAVSNMNAGNYPASLQQLRSLCRLAPLKPEVWQLMAEVYRRAGDLDASAGRYLWDDRDVTAEAWLVRDTVGFLPEEPLMRGTTVRDLL